MIYHAFFMLSLISSAPAWSSVNIPVTAPEPKMALPLGSESEGALQVVVPLNASCDFAQRPGLEFAFAELDGSLLRRTAGESGAEGDDSYVLWRLQPSPAAYSLPRSYGGRRGKITGEFFWNLGERWITAVLDDCSTVYAMDTSAQTPEGPLMHLQSVGRIYYRDHVRFAESLVGQRLRVNAATLEPHHRLYGEDGVAYPLRLNDSYEVLGVETRRFGFTKGIGGFYVRVRNARDETGLIKFHHDYLTGAEGQFLWSLQPNRTANGAVLVYNAGQATPVR